MTAQVIRADQKEALDLAVRLIQNGDVIAFPTDTVYGIAAGAFNPAGILRLYEIKGRERLKAIPILIGSLEQLPLVTASVSGTARRLTSAFWPGALTLILPKNSRLPAEISPYPTVGVRMPDHPVALAILKRTGPLAVTSANLSGQKEATNADEVLAQLGDSLAAIIDGGATPGGTPSTVVEVSRDELKILRPGPLSLDQLQHALW